MIAGAPLGTEAVGLELRFDGRAMLCPAGRILATSPLVSTVLRVGLATAAFAALHSALASVRLKEAAARHHHHGRELYRAVYNAHAVAAFGGLVWFIARQPKRTLYRATGATAVILRIGQAAGVAFAVTAARATGLGTLSGLDNVRALLAKEPWRPVPAAQGPESDPDGTLRIRGPFRAVRHPLNLAPVAPFWLTPHMTSRRLAFNLVATLYLVLGSVHEESRLRRQYGDRYEAYQRGGTPFFVPRVRSGGAPYARDRVAAPFDTIRRG